MVRRRRYRVTPEIRERGDALVLGRAEQGGAEGSKGMLVGKLAEQGPECSVWWSFEREAVVGIFGKRGSGKSYTLGVFVEGLATESGESAVGSVEDRAALVFDTLNIFQYAPVRCSEIPDTALREEALRRLRTFGLTDCPVSVRVSFPAGTEEPFYPETYEPFAVDTALIRPEDYAHLFEINLYRDPIGQLLLAAQEMAMERGSVTREDGTDAERGVTLRELVECLEMESSLSEQFAEETRRALGARLGALLRMPMFSGRGTPLNEFLRDGECRVLLLGRLEPPLRSVVAALLTRQVFNARARAAEANKFLRLRAREGSDEYVMAQNVVRQSPPRTVLLIDEAQGYAPPSQSNPCTQILIQYVKEGRNHGLSLIFASQQPSAIHPEVLSQVDAVVAHRLTVSTDIAATKKHAKGQAPEKIMSAGAVLSPDDLLRDLSQGQAWVSHGDSTRAVVLQVRPRISAHGGIEG